MSTALFEGVAVSYQNKDYNNHDTIFGFMNYSRVKLVIILGYNKPGTAQDSAARSAQNIHGDLFLGIIEFDNPLNIKFLGGC